VRWVRLTQNRNSGHLASCVRVRWTGRAGPRSQGEQAAAVVVFVSADYAALADARQRYGVIGGLPAWPV
jgi:hypothetical protein